jgi:hypothetical protein
MLPDYPELKRELVADLNLLLRLLVRQNAPLVGRIKNYRQVEGDKFTVETNEQYVTKTFKQLSAQVAIPAGLSSSDTHTKFMEQLVDAAENIAHQSEGMLFSTLDEVTASTGNVLDAKGEPFHPSVLWDMVEKTDLEFDEKTGKPRLPSIVLHPDVMKSILPKFAEWEADLELKARRTEVLEKKKDEWRDRESRRKLVG